MIDRILSTLRECNWDFDSVAYDGDHMRDMFPEWRRIYRLKWAIAKCLRPDNILEIGVRYGYSAGAFLAARPRSRYLGFDNNGDVSGGVAGSVRIARHLLARYDNATVEIIDTQKAGVLPINDQVWDLVHIDGDQRPGAMGHDLSLVCEYARHILVDGYTWTAENNREINDWIYQNRKMIQWFGVITDPAISYGDVLIVIDR